MNLSITGIIKEIVFIVIALTGVMLLINGVEALWHLPNEAALHVVVTVLAIFLSQLPKVFVLRREFAILFDHQKRIDPRVRNAVLSFLRPRLKKHLEEGRFLIDSKVMVNEEELQEFVKASFDACRGSYQGTDKHPPSELESYSQIWCMSIL